MTRRSNSTAAPPSLPGKRVSAEEAAVQYKYGSLQILRDGRVRFSAKTVTGLPELDFSARHGGSLGDGTYVWGRANYSIVANWPGLECFFMLFLSRHRVGSACFNFGLTPDDLRKAVEILRKAGGGLERWIGPGLEWTAEHGGNADLRKVIPELLESIRGIPIAEPWKRRRREWERWNRERERKEGGQVRKSRATPSSRRPRK